MARPITRPSLAALVAMVAAIALSGCGGGDGGDGPDLSAGLGPRELLERSAAEAATLESFRISFDAKGEIDLPEVTGAAAGLLGGPLSISGEGPVQPPDKASIDAELELAALSPQVNLTRVADEVFLGLLGQDFRLGLPPAQVALFDFGALYPTLAGWMTDPVEAGREDIDGTSTVKVTGGVDAVTALNDLVPLLQRDDTAVAVDTEAFEAAVTTGTIEAWIGTEDLRPRRVHVVLKADGAGVVPGVKAIDIDLTATLSAFDEPVDIRAPRNARDLDLDQLGALTGG
jgi:hypothetical protein